MRREKFLGPALALFIMFLFACLMPHGYCHAADEISEESHQLPRFVTIRAKEINLRTGPGERYPIDWVIRAKGWPVQIIAEFDNWRRVKDVDGTTGWVHRVMLSKKRAVVTMQDKVVLRRAPAPDAQARAQVAAHTHGELKKCQPGKTVWCEIDFDGGKGWLPAKAVWGVDEGELKAQKN